MREMEGEATSGGVGGRPGDGVYQLAIELIIVPRNGVRIALYLEAFVPFVFWQLRVAVGLVRGGEERVPQDPIYRQPGERRRRGRGSERGAAGGLTAAGLSLPCATVPRASTITRTRPAPSARAAQSPCSASARQNGRYSH